jgi:zinc D-Ala-D-Ala carboxypeptidase
MIKGLLFSFAGTLFVLAAVYFSFVAFNSKSAAQTLPARNITPTSLVRARKVETVTANPVFAAAALRNIDLKQNMQWTFGGKAQRGWSIYESLLCQLLNVEATNGDDFAANLARWQKSEGLAANGILDDASLAAIIKKWQSNRLKTSGYPAPEELTVAPAADFWDASRAAEMRQVERETYAAYKKMVAAAIADKSLNLATDANGNLAASEKYLKIVSAFRSREYQAKLRQASPNSGRAGLAVNSPHFTGRALDIYVGGEPVTTRDDNRALQVRTPVYKWLVKNAARFGFKPYFYEPWHWEYAPDAVAAANK